MTVYLGYKEHKQELKLVVTFRITVLSFVRLHIGNTEQTRRKAKQIVHLDLFKILLFECFIQLFILEFKD